MCYSLQCDIHAVPLWYVRVCVHAVPLVFMCVHVVPLWYVCVVMLFLCGMCVFNFMPSLCGIRAFSCPFCGMYAFSCSFVDIFFHVVPHAVVYICVLMLSPCDMQVRYVHDIHMWHACMFMLSLLSIHVWQLCPFVVCQYSFTEP